MQLCLQSMRNWRFKLWGNAYSARTIKCTVACEQTLQSVLGSYYLYPPEQSLSRSCTTPLPHITCLDFFTMFCYLLRYILNELNTLRVFIQT